MYFPKFQEVERYREMTTVFGGYNHQISCQEGQFYDMKNITADYFPVLSTRRNRGIIKQFENFQGILEKEDMWYIDSKVLYKNGVPQKTDGVEFSDEVPKVMAKMGAYIIVMPDKIWINTNVDDENLECGYMENKCKIPRGNTVRFSICDSQGKIIEWHEAEYYDQEGNEPKDGDYMMSITTDGKPSLKVYSATTGIWLTVSSPYVQITATGIGIGFEKGDGIKIVSDYNLEGLDNIFINDEGGNKYSTNTYIIDRSDDSITIPGIYKSKVFSFTSIGLAIERSVPEMAFITECNNRLWGCSKDGHEVYCCKLGDVKNWNCFRGISTDSWAATIGSDGKFTGAITYLGYPIFFKEDCLIKISVSSLGAHQTKETRCRGVQLGSERSLVILNEMLYYKSTSGVCGYNGSLPYSISEEFGEVKYYDAAAGTTGDKYYISMRDTDGKYCMFVYDVKNGIWCKEDEVNAMYFCKYRDELVFIDAEEHKMYSVGGTFIGDESSQNVEGKFDWFAESGDIGYTSPDSKYVGRINIRISLDVGTDVNFDIQYDSNGIWERKINMCGSGTRTFSVPLIPKRCDHFKYRISGKGNCKIHSVAKTLERGSDGL